MQMSLLDKNNPFGSSSVQQSAAVPPQHHRGHTFSLMTNDQTIKNHLCLFYKFRVALCTEFE